MAAIMANAAEASTILAFLVMLPGAWAAALKQAEEHRRRRHRPRHARPGRHDCRGTQRQPESLAFLAVTKRTQALSVLGVLGVLVAGIALGIAWHEPKSMNLPDGIRTWGGFIVVVIGAGAALWQLDMQRRQLADQQEVLKGEVERNKKRDALIGGQLLELEQRSLTYERQQAQDVDIRGSAIVATIPGMGVPAEDLVCAEQLLCTAEVKNESARPIRDVACRIEPAPGDALQEAGRVGRLVSFNGAVSGHVLTDQAYEPKVGLVRADAVFQFIFPVEAESHPKARITARFTDDAGLHWQIDPDLHLEKLSSRDW